MMSASVRIGSVLKRSIFIDLSSGGCVLRG